MSLDRRQPAFNNKLTPEQEAANLSSILRGGVYHDFSQNTTHQNTPATGAELLQLQKNKTSSHTTTSPKKGPIKRTRMHRLEYKGEVLTNLQHIDDKRRLLAFIDVKIKILESLHPDFYSPLDFHDSLTKKDLEDLDIPYTVLRERSVSDMQNNAARERKNANRHDVTQFEEQYNEAKGEHDDDFEEYILQFSKDDSLVQDAYSFEKSQQQLLRKEKGYLENRKKFISLHREIGNIIKDLKQSQKAIDTNSTPEHKKLEQLKDEYCSKAVVLLQQTFNHETEAVLENPFNKTIDTYTKSIDINNELNSLDNEIQELKEIIEGEYTDDHLNVENHKLTLGEKLPEENIMRIHMLEYIIDERLRTHYEQREEFLSSLRTTDKEISKKTNTHKKVHSLIQKRHLNKTVTDRNPDEHPRYSMDALLQSRNTLNEELTQLTQEKRSLQAVLHRYEHLPHHAHKKILHLSFLKTIVSVAHSCNQELDTISEFILLLNSDLEHHHIEPFLSDIHSKLLNVQKYFSQSFVHFEDSIRRDIQEPTQLFTESDCKTIFDSLSEVEQAYELLLEELSQYTIYQNSTIPILSNSHSHMKKVTEELLEKYPSLQSEQANAKIAEIKQVKEVETAAAEKAKAEREAEVYALALQLQEKFSRAY